MRKDDVSGGGGASRSGIYLVRECSRGEAGIGRWEFQFTTITLRPTIKLVASTDAAKAKELIEKAEANCLISNSMKTRVSLEPTIR
ncbi:MAG: OsmC family protein [Nitrospiraceae bacterium]|nr:OsmC family protein [Nitrospiraceae bacterium]